uniref:Spt4/RpoE2 zinc finger domain-containing protein n=1 Tax=Trepomonas sp. PC1 TaxID=1076344 RepID=A0A146K609_9EUKA|eukprot:JAP91066.1 hypothetical protein TPC1_17428 [Trepomonas sp. PC1]
MSIGKTCRLTQPLSFLKSSTDFSQPSVLPWGTLAMDSNCLLQAYWHWSNCCFVAPLSSACRMKASRFDSWSLFIFLQPFWVSKLINRSASSDSFMQASSRVPHWVDLIQDGICLRNSEIGASFSNFSSFAITTTLARQQSRTNWTRFKVGLTYTIFIVLELFTPQINSVSPRVVYNSPACLYVFRNCGKSISKSLFILLYNQGIKTTYSGFNSELHIYVTFSIHTKGVVIVELYFIARKIPHHKQMTLYVEDIDITDLKRLQACQQCFYLSKMGGTCQNCKKSDTFINQFHGIISLIDPDTSYMKKLLSKQTGYTSFIPGFYALSLTEAETRDLDE